MKAGRTLSWSLLTAAFLVWFFIFRPAVLGGPASYVVVTGHSMEPTLHTGDFVFTHRQSSYAPGDVVAYTARDSGATGTVIHRVVGGNAVAGYEMKGDNKDFPDPWTPTGSEVLGKRWFHVEGGGALVEKVKQPQNLVIMVTVLVGLSFLGGGEVRRRRRNSRGSRMTTQPGKSTGSETAAPTWAMAALGVGALLTLAVGFQTFKALRKHATSVVSVTTAKLDQTAAFDYTIMGFPSTLYPTGIVGPIVAPANDVGDGRVPPVPFYTRQAHSVRLGFTYGVSSDQPVTVTGETSAVLQIKAAGDDGWTKTRPLLDPTPFTGASNRIETNIELAPIQDLIDQIEKETGFQPNSYDLAIVYTVAIKGQVGGQPLEETFSPAFTIKYQRTSLTPDASLRRTKAGSHKELVTRHATAFLGLSVPRARLVGGAATLLAAVVTAAFASVVFLGAGLDETAKNQIRYGTKTIDVSEARTVGLYQVEVARLEDLAALAARYDRVVFKQRVPEGERYFVTDGDVTYRYLRRDSASSGAKSA